MYSRNMRTHIQNVLLSRHHDLVNLYGLSESQMTMDIFDIYVLYRCCYYKTVLSTLTTNHRVCNTGNTMSITNAMQWESNWLPFWNT